VAKVRIRELVSGAAAGVVGGYVGTKVMNQATTKLQEPDRAYPLSTPLRGFLGHLAYGAAVAATAEVLMSDRR
jgi:hypothetical protein